MAWLQPSAPKLSDHVFPARGHAYWFDAEASVRYFRRDLRWHHIPGDVTKVPAEPAVVKSRPIGANNENAVLLALNTVRHFVFVDDRVSFRDKLDTACFRGKVPDKQLRMILFSKWFGRSEVDLGDTADRPVVPEWTRPPMTIKEQLRHKFILSVEGNDVASNLKWILSSNSVAVMPKPRFETCFEEGRLVPGIHYIEVAPDFSDLAEVLRFHAARPALCERISAAGRAWSARFRDPLRERLVALLTLERYFRATGQDPDACCTAPEVSSWAPLPAANGAFGEVQGRFRRGILISR